MSSRHYLAWCIEKRFDAIPGFVDMLYAGSVSRAMTFFIQCKADESAPSLAKRRCM
jgi:hypothetical protein